MLNHQGESLVTGLHRKIQRGYFLKDYRISCYFDTKYMTVLQIEKILHNFEDQKFANFLNLERVNFRVTLVNMFIKSIS